MSKKVWTVGVLVSGALFCAALGLVSAQAPPSTSPVDTAALAGGAVGSATSQSAAPVAVDASTGSTPAVSAQRALLDRYCVGCHSTRLKVAGLSLSAADIDLDHVAEDLDVWEKVVRKLRARAMPPAGPGRQRPDESGYDGLIAHLETRLDRLALERPDPGPVEKFRRLNRTEYQNAVRDLLNVDVDAASLLPTDDSSHGFDNVNVSGVSPTLLDRYLAAAQKISRLAVGRVPAAAHTVVLPVDLTQDDWLDGLPFGTRGGATFRHTFPADGVYRFDIRLTRDRDERIEGSHFEQLDLMLDGRLLQSYSLTPRKEGSAQSLATFTRAAEETDEGLMLRTAVTAGAHDIAATFQRASGALSETERQPYKANYTYRSRAAVFSVTVSGPFDVSGPGDTPARRRIFICQPSSTAAEPDCAKTILTNLARRAYRRPVTGADVDPLLAFYSEARAAGEGFEAGIEVALRAILASPGFLFRVESQPAPASTPGAAYRVSDIDLASRLSFFLWSSIPDDALLDAAIDGRLSEDGELERQVQRMLADPRSEALIHSFADQWLFLRNVETMTRDLRLFPDFDDNLRQAFKRETQMLFESILREDRSVLDLLRADYTFVNERLARHYGIPGISGSHFRRVSLGSDSVRRGLLGHASFLSVTSYANRTSPVQRGMWVLKNVLGMDLPPPPPDVPPLKEEDGERKVLTMRERMVKHRANPTCASCHQLMDPIGLAFENYDAVGQWRTQESQAGEPAGEPIDASGGLPDGRTFEGAVAMREALLHYGDLFVVTATEKMLVYALGRGLEAPDAPSIRAIVANAQRDDYRFSTLVTGIVHSTPFRMRRSE